MPNTGMQSRRKALWVVATIIVAVALHPAIANARGGGAPTDPQIVGAVEAANQIDINYANLGKVKSERLAGQRLRAADDYRPFGRAEIYARPRCETQHVSGRQPNQQLAKKAGTADHAEAASPEGQGVR